MGKSGKMRRCGLTGEALVTDGRHARIGQHLDRDRSIVSLVVSEIHRGHPAPAQLAVDTVALRQRFEVVERLGHFRNQACGHEPAGAR